jgi:folate-binding protein YgfZ
MPQAPQAEPWALVSARGPDAVGFLHGQLTQDVKLLGEHEARWAAYCSVKGRMQASALVCKPEPDCVWMACHDSVAASWVKRLKMFVLRSRCELAADTQLGVWGWASKRAEAPEGLLGLAEMSHSGSVGGAFWLRLSDVQGWVRGLYLAAQAPVGAASTQPGLWDWLQVRSGVSVITQATADAFVPQMVNFEVVGGVNFKKGCYPGQEVVARAQYRGTVKRRLFLLEGQAPAEAGQAVFAAALAPPAQAPAGETEHEVEGEAVGMVVNAAACPQGLRAHESEEDDHQEDGHHPAGPGSERAGGPRLEGAPAVPAPWSALVELRLGALGAGLRLGSPDGPPLWLAPQPYALPSEDEA